MSEFITIEGALSWVKVDPNNPEPPFGNEKAGKWSSCIHPANRDDLDLIRDLQSQGLKNVIKKDENGYYTKFSRPVARYKGDELVKKFEPPKLTGALPQEIGNGSLGKLTLEIYEHATPGGVKKAKAARLHAVEITRLTPRT